MGQNQIQTYTKIPLKNTDKQHHNNFGWLKKYQWKKGQSGNPNGRPKEKTLKEWVRKYLANLNDEGRKEFLKRVNLELAWKMAEGNPGTDITTGGEPVKTFSEESIYRIAERIVGRKGSNSDTSDEKKPN